jgi:predicted nucleic acid-binding protein
MILVDANLLIYVVNQDSPHHDSVRHWLEEML